MHLYYEDFTTISKISTNVKENMLDIFKEFSLMFKCGLNSLSMQKKNPSIDYHGEWRNTIKVHFCNKYIGKIKNVTTAI